MLYEVITPLLYDGRTLGGPDNLLWCEGGDSNPHGMPLDPKSSASTNSAILAENAFLLGNVRRAKRCTNLSAALGAVNA